MLPSTRKNVNIQKEGAKRQPDQPKRCSPKHMTIQMQKVNNKVKIVEMAREKDQITFKTTPI